MDTIQLRSVTTWYQLIMSGEEKDICVNNLLRLTAERPVIERGDLSLARQPADCTNKPQKGSSR